MSRRSMAVQPTGYCSPKLEGRLIKAKGGRALFARERVKQGEVLLVWGGEVVTGDTLKWMSEDKRRISVQIEEDLYLVTSNEGPSDWVNHSCDPNAGVVGQVVLVALRDVRVGEEICFDYATTDGSPYDEFACGCATKTCRGHVTGDDWRLPALQTRYAGHFSPYIQRRIDRLRNGKSAGTRASAPARKSSTKSTARAGTRVSAASRRS